MWLLQRLKFGIRGPLSKGSEFSFLSKVITKHCIFYSPQNPPPCSKFSYFSTKCASSNFNSKITEKVESRLFQLKNDYERLQHDYSKEASKSDGSSELVVKFLKEIGSKEVLYHMYIKILQNRKELSDVEQLLQDDSQFDLHELANEEHKELLERMTELEEKVIRELLPKDSADEGNALLEIRAGAGGAEASLFAGDILRMYERYCILKGWKFEILSISEGDQEGAIKDATASMSGMGVFGQLKYESGVHRVQRVPSTEQSGRIHTSTITVAILPQPTEVEVRVDEKDLRIDVFRASGAGGQHVNTTESAVRITHIPTGIVVAIQDERSQHKNKAKAMKILRARIYEQQRERVMGDRREARNQLIGSGNRSEKIRTYNIPQSRATDHRINFSLHGVDRVLSGELLDIIINEIKMQQEVEELASIVM